MTNVRIGRGHVLLDADLRVQITMRAGRVVYLADGTGGRLAPHLREQG